MREFDARFFQKMKFEKRQIQSYINSAQKSLEIAKNVDIPDVIFKFSYDALIKSGIAIIAFNGYKVRSNPGHHIKILQTLAKILDDQDVEAIGNMMRTQRNHDLYCGDTIITKKQSLEYFIFVGNVFDRIRKRLADLLSGEGRS